MKPNTKFGLVVAALVAAFTVLALTLPAPAQQAQQSDAELRREIRGLLDISNAPPSQINATNGVLKGNASVGGTATIGTGNIATQAMPNIIKTGAVPFTVSIDTVTNSAGAAIKVLTLTP